MATKVFQRYINQKKCLRILSNRQCYHSTLLGSSSETIFSNDRKLFDTNYNNLITYSKRYLQCRIENNIVQSPFPDVDVPELPLGQFILDSFAEHGNRIAIVCANTNHSYKYREVIEYSRIFGSALIRNGFEPGDTLSIHSYNIPEYLIAIVGCLAVGGIVCPVNPNNPVPELIRELSGVKPKFLLCGNECLHNGLAAAKEVLEIKKVFSFGMGSSCVSFKDLLLDDGSLFKLHTDINVKEQVAFIMYSSGTTGLPRGAMLTHYNIIANLLQHRTEGQHKVTKESVTLGILPYFHSFGLFVILLNYSINGGKIVSLGKFEPELFLKKVTKLNVNRLNLVPYVVNFLSTSPIVEKYNLGKVRYLVAGAAPLTTSVLDSLKARLPNAVITQGFGMTELSPVSHSHPVGGVDIASVGYPVANTEAKIRDLNTGDDAGIDQPGEMLIRGPQVMKGYMNDEIATKISIDEDGWLHTGDIAYFDKEGKFYIVGRIKEMIKYKGIQVSPKELENILIEHPAIVDAGVVGIPDEVSGELPAALIVLHQNYLDTNVDEIHEYIGEKVSKSKQLVGGIKIVEAIPRTSVGKLVPSESLKVFVSK